MRWHGLTQLVIYLYLDSSINSAPQQMTIYQYFKVLITNILSSCDLKRMLFLA
jgi:hypothetical protein